MTIALARVTENMAPVASRTLWFRGCSGAMRWTAAITSELSVCLMDDVVGLVNVWVSYCLSPIYYGLFLVKQKSM